MLEEEKNAIVPQKDWQNWPLELTPYFARYPENKRRPVNKTLFRDDDFELVYHVKEKKLQIRSRGDLVYSAIPYDTARHYIQRAAVQYLLHPNEVRQYIERHEPNVRKYLALSLFQVSQQVLAENSLEVSQAYHAIFQDPLLEIQILGRLLQHDETGPLSANLAGKFLYTENVKTGISGYVFSYLNFLLKLTQSLPITTNGKKIEWLDYTADGVKTAQLPQFIYADSDVTQALALLPRVQQPPSSKPSFLAQTSQPAPLRRSVFGRELSEVRKNYLAHSVKPAKLENYFEKVLPNENFNVINVVSDLHVTNGEIPFINHRFNLIAGDLTDAPMQNATLTGLYVLGNHELIAALPTETATKEEREKWAPFQKYQWFQQLLAEPEEAWYLLPIGDHPFYQMVQETLQPRFPQLRILHNQSFVHDGVRYLGLTIPVASVQRKKAWQRYLFQTLTHLLGEDKQTPTVIISHAPLCNELSRLSPRSPAYNPMYTCADKRIESLFQAYSIIGVIHGHHHIPASFGRYKQVEFGGKELFVVCSIYSDMNTGFDLTELLPKTN